MTTALTASASLPPQKSSTERQLELTLNAIARSMRKAIRLAEKQDPTGTSGGLWKAVEHRAGMLETMLKAAAEYMRAFAPAQAEDSPAKDEAPAATPVERSAKPAPQRHEKVQNPAPTPEAKRAVSTPPAPAPVPTTRPVATKTSGNGWRLAA